MPGESLSTEVGGIHYLGLCLGRLGDLGGCFFRVWELVGLLDRLGDIGWPSGEVTHWASVAGPPAASGAGRYRVPCQVVVVGRALLLPRSNFGSFCGTTQEEASVLWR